VSEKDITDFDSLTIDQLLEKPTPELIVAIFMKLKLVNGKVNWHDKFIWGLISTMGLGIMAALIIGIINICFKGI
jgi:hypothetical protein